MSAIIGGIIAALLIIAGILLSESGVFIAMRKPELIELTRHFQPENETYAKVWVNPDQVLYVYSRSYKDESWTAIYMTGSSGNTSNVIEVNEQLEKVVRLLK